MDDKETFEVRMPANLNQTPPDNYYVQNANLLSYSTKSFGPR